MTHRVMRTLQQAIRLGGSAFLILLVLPLGCSGGSNDGDPSQGAASGGTPSGGTGTAGAIGNGGGSATAGSATGGTAGLRATAGAGPSGGAGSQAAAGTSASAGMSASAGANAGAGRSGSSGGGTGGIGSPANGGAGTAGTAGTAGMTSGYDAAVLGDQPVAYWGVNMAPGVEPDLSGNGHQGTYLGGGSPPRVALPNGALAADFNGSSQYLTVPSSPAFSIATTGLLTWEAWIRPDVLQFPHDDGSSGYVDWMGKCESYGPTCEWEARMYDLTTKEVPNRPNRFSAYVFNPSAGLGSGADWQPAAGVITAGSWYHVVAEYTTQSAPTDCAGPEPGSINIWVNGVPWNHASHGQTGCMSQYHVVPKANGSALNIGTMAKESYFQGAIGKVALYNRLLSPAQITKHYSLMTGKVPSGSCANTCGF